MRIRQRCWTAIALYLLSLPGSQLTSANAMVLASGESGTNTADPRIGLALNHIGIANNGQSGVYLGNYHGKSWVLTANHVGPGSFELGGITYSAVAGSAHQLLNPDSTLSDILLFQINGDPGLSPLNLASASPTNDTRVYMIGFGQSGQPNRSYWIDDGGPWVPTVAGDPAANRIGYQWTGVQPGDRNVGALVQSLVVLMVSIKPAPFTRNFWIRRIMPVPRQVIREGAYSSDKANNGN